MIIILFGTHLTKRNLGGGWKYILLTHLCPSNCFNIAAGCTDKFKEIDLMPNPNGLSYFFADMAPSNKNVDVNSDVKSVCMLRN